MVVPPHPHTGLQTVSWLFEGEIEHRDSTGSHELVRPGERQPDDRGARHLALRGVDARHDAAARRAALGRAARRLAHVAPLLRARRDHARHDRRRHRARVRRLASRRGHRRPTSSVALFSPLARRADRAARRRRGVDRPRPRVRARRARRPRPGARDDRGARRRARRRRRADRSVAGRRQLAWSELGTFRRARGRAPAASDAPGARAAPRRRAVRRGAS